MDMRTGSTGGQGSIAVNTFSLLEQSQLMARRVKNEEVHVRHSTTLSG